MIGCREDSPSSSSYRDLGFRDSYGNWWRDGEHFIKDKDTLYHKILQRKPYQIHIDLLHQYDNGREIIHRELVFDIDVTDFVKYCDKESCDYCCTTCWLHIEGASLLLDYLFRRVMGINPKNMLWVLSGKKGIHCIVNDPIYLLQGLKQKEAIYHFLTKNTLDELAQFGSTLPPDFIQEMREMFVSSVIERRALLDREEFTSFCLTLIKSRYPSLHYPLLTQWNKGGTCLERWNYLLMIEGGVGDDTTPPSVLIILHLYYPKIDKGPLCEKHLFKLPFSIHTDTKKVGLPVTLEGIRKDGLPHSSISLSDVVTLYNKKGEIHPDFFQGALLLDQWLQK
jgi:hypothetical protein